jgi:predicted porin
MANGESQSRIGFKGQEDLGGGTKAIFLLETGFNPVTGDIASNGMAGNGAATSAAQGGDNALQGILFNRGAYVGLTNPQWGAITLGRQQNLMLENIGNYNPVNAQMFSPIAFSGTYGGGGYTDSATVNQAVKYKFAQAGFNANVLYATGGIAGNFTAGVVSGLQFGYENARWGVQAIASHAADATSLTGATATGTSGSLMTPAQLAGTAPIIPAMGLNVTLSNTTAYQLTTKFQATDSLNIKAGYERELIGVPSDFRWYSSMPMTVSGYTIASMTANKTNKAINVYWVGANYNFTPKIMGSIGYYYAGTAQTQGVAQGVQQFQSAMLDYYWSKRTNLYLGIMNVNTSGASVQPLPAGSMMSGKTVSTQQTYGAGMRHTF